MKVESIRIENFKAIADEEIDINGNNVYVIGKNGVGKSSFIDSVFSIISGKYPVKPTKAGAKKGSVEIDLGEMIVKARFNDKKEKIELEIESKEGATYKAPRTMLDDLAGVVDFNLNEFFNKKPKDQVDFIKQLVGIDFTDLDDEYQKVYEERTIINRKVKELEPQLKLIDKDKTEPIDITALQEKIQRANDVNSKIKEVKTRQTERESQIEETKTQIAALQEKLSDLESKKDQAKEWLSKNTEVDISAMQDEFSKAVEHNQKVEQNKANIKTKAEFDKAIADQERINARIQEIQDTKKRIISGSQMPVPGLSFDENGLIYNGLPFDKSQINTAQLIIIGLQINLALLKDVKIARFDASQLDNENIKLIEEWARENDLQLFVELVDRNAEGMKIVIKEGSGELQEV